MGIFSWIILILVLILSLILFIIKKGIDLRIKELNSHKLDLTGKTYRNHLKEKQLLFSQFSHEDITHEIGHDVLSCGSLNRFRVIMDSSQCTFAKKAKIWGCKDWDPQLSLEENVAQNIMALTMFLELGKGLHLEGFVFEVRGIDYASSVEIFGDTVRRVLSTISKNDPRGVDCMSKSYIDKKGWWFEFNNEFIFVTTFAGCYPENHSRYMFNADRESCFVLLQPEYSFAWRNIDSGPEPTNWTEPNSIRDIIRVNFKNHGRNYILNEDFDPVGAHIIVKPMALDAKHVEWWKPLN